MTYTKTAKLTQDEIQGLIQILKDYESPEFHPGEIHITLLREKMPGDHTMEIQMDGYEYDPAGKNNPWFSANLYDSHGDIKNSVPVREDPFGAWTLEHLADTYTLVIPKPNKEATE